jgi:LysM repeat protein
MNIVDNSGKGLAALGRNEDRFMAHVAQGEMVVPPVISDNTKALIRQEMRAVGLNPQEYEVGQGMSINPITGQAEFGFLKKLAKNVKKVVKKVAPIAAVIPGPWQPFAAVYQKGNAALKLAKGEGGLGDIMTVMAGGNQSVFGTDGALKSITSGDFKNIGGGFMDSLGSIGKVTDAAGKSSYDLLGYGKNVAKGMASDQKQGYFGAFGGNTGKFDVNTGQFVDFVGGPQGFNPLAPKQTVVNQGDTLSQIAQKNGTTVEAIMEANPGITDPNLISAGQTLNMPGGNILQKTGNVIRSTTGIGDGKPGALGLGGEGSFFGMETPGVIKKAGDLLGLGGASGLKDAYGNSGSGGGGSGINPQMAALALLYGKAVKDFTKKN